MAKEKSADIIQVCAPPAYSGVFGNETSTKKSSSTKSKLLFGYAVSVSTALIVALILGGVYYYRSLDVIQEAIKKFKVTDTSGDAPVTQEVEIDAENQYVTLRLNGPDFAPGTFAVVDYAKSTTGIYDPQSKRCFLIPGIKTKIADLESWSLEYEKNNHTQKVQDNKETFNYIMADNYPVSDKSILSAPLRTACKSLPVYWLEPATSKTHDLQKRKAKLIICVSVSIGCTCITLCVSISL